MNKIRIMVSSGVAEVDAKTVPDSVDVVILDLDVLIDQPDKFAELSQEDQEYLESEYPDITKSIKEGAGLLKSIQDGTYLEEEEEEEEEGPADTGEEDERESE